MRVIVVNIHVIGVNLHVIGMNQRVIGVQTKFVSGVPKCVYVEGHPYDVDM